MDLKGEYINMFHEGLVPILLSVGVNLRGQELLLVAWNCVFKPDFIFHTHLYNEGVYCSSTSDCFWGILNVHILLVKYIERGVSRCSERHGVGVRVPARHGLDSLLDAQQGHLELLRKAELTGKIF